MKSADTNIKNELGGQTKLQALTKLSIVTDCTEWCALRPTRTILGVYIRPFSSRRPDTDQQAYPRALLVTPWGQKSTLAHCKLCLQDKLESESKSEFDLKILNHNRFYNSKTIRTWHFKVQGDITMIAFDTLHIYDTAEKSPQQQFEGNMTMSAVITLWELLTKCQTTTFIMNNSDKLTWLPTDFITSQQWV
jgi:hypothetical protein